MTANLDFDGHFQVFGFEPCRNKQGQPGYRVSHTDLVEWNHPFGHFNALPDTSAESAITLPLLGRLNRLAH